MKILSYTRKPLEDMIYNTHMACSMHLAWEDENGAYQPFHHNEGILYAKAVHHEDGTMTAKCLRSPRIFRTRDGAFGVAAVRTEADGSPDALSDGCVMLFVSRDLAHYDELGLYRLQAEGEVCQVALEWDQATGLYHVTWENADGAWHAGWGDPFADVELRDTQAAAAAAQLAWDTAVMPEGACPCGVIEVTNAEADYLKKKLLTPVCVSVTVEGEGEDARALSLYSDGTTVARRIDWTNTTDEAAMGLVHQEHFATPFASNRADPCLMYWHGAYYFIATNDLDDNHSLYIRRSDTLQGIETAKDVLLLDSKMYEDIGGLLWAPEFHEIAGRMYIFHAATRGPFFEEESRVMALRKGGDPMNREDWSRPRLVVKQDGMPLCEAGKVISLDMTTYEVGGHLYAMWSQRQFLPVDQGAWLMTAEIDPQTPWQLLSDPVCVAKPEYSWENNHTYVVEGPFALPRDGQLMITYSGAAVDATYCVGLLKLKVGGDPLDPGAWEKTNYPLMSSSSAWGEYGPGHNAYVVDENGMTWNSYHAHVGVRNPRSSCMRRVHFDIDGEPMLDVTEALDFPEMARHIAIRKDQDGQKQ